VILIGHFRSRGVVPTLYTATAEHMGYDADR
jgi:hypothetical protein